MYYYREEDHRRRRRSLVRLEDGGGGGGTMSSPDGVDSGIGNEPSTTGTGSEDESSASCDCVCACCCKCKETAGEAGEGASLPTVTPTSPLIGFLSQQYMRLPSLQPPTPTIERSDQRYRTTGEDSIAAMMRLRSRSVPRLSELPPPSAASSLAAAAATAVIKRNDDNTIAAIVRRRRRLKRRAKSGDFQSLPPDHRTFDATENRETVTTSTTGSTNGSSSTVEAGALNMAAVNKRRTLEIKFVW